VKTRQRDRGAPEPQEPWNEVTSRLWLGGHFWAGPDGEGQAAVVGDEFDLVISLFTREGHEPNPGVDHLISEITDSPLTAEHLHSVQRLAVTAAEAGPRQSPVMSVLGERLVLGRARQPSE